MCDGERRVRASTPEARDRRDTLTSDHDWKADLAQLCEQHLITLERCRTWVAIHSVPRHELDRLEGIAANAVSVCLAHDGPTDGCPKLQNAFDQRFDGRA